MSNKRGEFYFPLKREQLLDESTDDRFVLDNTIIIDEETDDSLKNYLDDLSSELDRNIDSLYNSKVYLNVYRILYNYNRSSQNLKKKIIESFSRFFKKFSKEFEEFFEKSTEQQQLYQNTWRNSFKVYIFTMDWVVENIINSLKGQVKEIKKGRRKVKGSVNSTNDNNNIKGKQSKKSKRKKPDNNKALYNSDDEDLNNNEKIDPKEFNNIINKNIISILYSIQNIINHCEIKNLFKNKIIDDEIVNKLIKICFDSLEISIEIKILDNKNLIFETLQSIISKYQSNTNIQLVLLKLTTKIVNLIYSQEQLVTPLGDLIVFCINGESNLNKMAVDIIHEVSKTVFEDKNMDSQGLRNVGNFLVLLSKKSSKTLYNNITSLLQLFDSESYVIRNSLVDVITNVIINLLCKLDDINEVDVRNNYLKAKENFIDILFRRIYDKSSYCRAKILQDFEILCDNNTISVQSYLQLLNETSGRLHDEKSIVRKRAISLIKKIITMYSVMFKCDKFLNREEIKELIENCRKKIEEKENKIKFLDNDTNINKINEGINNEEKAKLNEEINKEEMMIEFFKNYSHVIDNIDKVVPCITELLGSKNVTDVCESIELFVVLHKLRIQSADKGVRKMLTLIMKPEKNIRDEIIKAFKTIYFDDNLSKDVQAASLVYFCAQLNFSEFTCIDELFKYILCDSKFDKSVFKDIWKILLKRPENEMKNIKASNIDELNSKIRTIEKESLTALQLINIASKYEEGILLNYSDLYIKNINANLTKKQINWVLIKHSLEGLIKIYPLKKDISESCLLRIARAIVREYGNQDNNWFSASKEMIDTIFQIVNEPEKICEYLIIKLSQPFFMTEDPLKNEETHNKFMTQNLLSQAPIDLNSQLQINTNSIQTPINNTNHNISPMKLAQLIFVIGHVALNMVIYGEKLEVTIKKKFTGIHSSSKKNKSNLNLSKDDINDIAGGKEAEADYNISLLHKLIDEDILKKHLIAKFIPMIVNIAKETLICSNHELNKNQILYKSAILSLCKLMCINQSFCQENLPFIFDLLKSDSINSDLKLNICLAFGDFINRFPNTLQQVINKFFDCLHSKDKNVVKYTLIVISHLVLNDMLKLKGEVVDICMLLDSSDNSIKNHVNLFFQEINTKGNNVIYNIIPKALARLSSEYHNLPYEKFQNIARTLLKYVDKEKHIEGLVDKLFVKLKNSNELIEWRNTTYVLSLLNYNSEKILMKFLESYADIKDKCDDDEDVKANLNEIFTKFNKIQNLNPNIKETLENAEKKIMKGEKLIIKNNNSKKSSRSISRANSKNVSRSPSKRKKRTHKQMEAIDEEDEIVKEKKNKSKGRISKRNIKKKKPKKKKNESESENDFEDDYSEYSED